MSSSSLEPVKLANRIVSRDSTTSLSVRQNFLPAASDILEPKDYSNSEIRLFNYSATLQFQVISPVMEKDPIWRILPEELSWNPAEDFFKSLTENDLLKHGYVKISKATKYFSSAVFFFFLSSLMVGMSLEFYTVYPKLALIMLFVSAMFFWMSLELEQAKDSNDA